MRDLEKYNENFDKIYNSFSKETVGNNQIKLMPPLSNKPKIQRLSYDKEKDVFEIVFKFDNASRTKKSDNVIFVENNNGELLAVQITSFSKLKVEKIKISIKSTLDAKIQQLSLYIQKKERIVENIIDKRKLNFVKSVIQNDYNEISKGTLNLIKQET